MEEETFEIKAAGGSHLARETRHAMRTPLNQILGYCELLGDELTEREQKDLLPDVDRIIAAGNDLLRQIEKVGEAEATAGSPTLDDAISLASRFVDELVTPQETIFGSQERKEAGLILVVDDQEANRDVLSRILEKRGYTVQTASSGEEALRKIGTESEFDLILLDVLMPDMDGREVLSKLKGEDSTRALPVIMISGVDDSESVVQCLDLGAFDFVSKPFIPSVLRARVSSSIDRSVPPTGKLNFLRGWKTTIEGFVSTWLPKKLQLSKYLAVHL